MRGTTQLSMMGRMAILGSILPTLIACQMEMESRKAELAKFMACSMSDADAWRYAAEAAISMDLRLAIHAASRGEPYVLVPRQ